MPGFFQKDFSKDAKPAADADMAAVAQERGIEFFLIAFIDIKGVLRTKMVPAAAISEIQKNGAGFAPAATYLDYGPHAADLIAKPDPSTLWQIPFQPELAMVMSDCYINNMPVKQSPRWVLKEQIAKAAAKGYVFKTGCEPEFFLLNADGETAISDAKDRESKPCYDAQAMMRRYALLTDIVKSLNSNGFGVYQTDHEDANGQFEINWHYQDCLTMSDQLVFFKWTVKTLAEKHGFRATFMPRPFAALAGNGCHLHCSLWKGGKNVFAAPTGAVKGKMLSDLALGFLGGVLKKAPTFCAITNPSVNSYKRLNGAATVSGSTWSPNRVSWSGNNRSHMVRVPDSDRFELRLADGATNPYLLPAVVLAAGLWGMQKMIDPDYCGFPESVNMYEILDGAPELANVESLPGNLLDATRAFDADDELKSLLGDDFSRAFVKLQKTDWQAFSANLSAWEVENTLDC